MLRREKGRDKAVYITAKSTGVQAATGVKAQTLMTKTDLDPPKSGWDEFDRFLQVQGVDSPVKLTLDDKHIPDPDEEIIAVEVRSGAEYSMVFFSPHTESTDGRKVLAVCHRIEREFDILMGC
jgi:hypothetical protein